MIAVTVFHSKQGICGFSLKGHSGYGEEGSDIVCAAASSIAQYIIEAVETMKVPCRYELKDGLITFSFTQETSGRQKLRVQDFLIPFETVMKQLSLQYGEYLKICSLEV